MAQTENFFSLCQEVYYKFGNIVAPLFNIIINNYQDFNIKLPCLDLNQFCSFFIQYGLPIGIKLPLKLKSLCQCLETAISLYDDLFQFMKYRKSDTPIETALKLCLDSYNLEPSICQLEMIGLLLPFLKDKVLRIIFIYYIIRMKSC